MDAQGTQPLFRSQQVSFYQNNFIKIIQVLRLISFKASLKILNLIYYVTSYLLLFTCN